MVLCIFVNMYCYVINICSIKIYVFPIPLGKSEIDSVSALGAFQSYIVKSPTQLLPPCINIW